MVSDRAALIESASDGPAARFSPIIPGSTPTPFNDYVTTTIGGSFVGESLFRMASLLLEGGGGGERPGFWRELGAAVISPPTGLNRLVFGDRFKPVFPSRDPAVYVRLRLGATLTTDVNNAVGLSEGFKRQEGSGMKRATVGASRALVT